MWQGTQSTSQAQVVTWWLFLWHTELLQLKSALSQQPLSWRGAAATARGRGDPALAWAQGSETGTSRGEQDNRTPRKGTGSPPGVPALLFPGRPKLVKSWSKFSRKDAAGTE